MPKRTKHRKTFRVRYDGKAKGNTELHMGEYGLMALDGAWNIKSNRSSSCSYDKIHEPWW